jgi:hypothetical protein
MPRTIQIDGADVVVYDQAEFNRATTDARVKAESDTKAKYEPQLTDLQAKATLSEQLTSQLAEATAQRDAAQRTLGLSTAARKAGLAEPVIEIALGHKQADTLDLTNAEHVTAFLSQFAALGTPTTPPPTPPAQATGTPGAPAAGPLLPKTLAEAEAMVNANPALASDPTFWAAASALQIQS